MVQGKNLKKEDVIKKSVWHFFDYMGVKDNYTYYKGPQYSWIKNLESQYAFPNKMIYRLQPNLQKDIEAIVHQAKALKVLWVEGLDLNKEMIQALERYGLKKRRVYPAMYLNIENLKQVQSNVDGLDIKLVEDSTDLYDWAKVMVQGWWEGDEVITQEVCRNFEKLYKDTKNIRLYLGMYDGKPVATSMAVLSEETVGLYLVSTWPGYQNKGIGKRMTIAPMLDAQQQGCQHAILQATEEGERIYKQLGFEEVFKYLIFTYEASNS